MAGVITESFGSLVLKSSMNRVPIWAKMRVAIPEPTAIMTTMRTVRRITVAAYVWPVGFVRKETQIVRMERITKKLYMKLSFQNGTLKILRKMT